MRFSGRTLAGVAVLSFLFGSLVQASDVLRADGDFFRDPQGRAIFLRGVNVSGDSKFAPFLPLQGPGRSGKIDPMLLDPLSGWGFNTIRLLFTWEAYEPEPGHYNEAYLDQLTQLADQAWARGLYVIVDMHQDAFSRYLAGGCGEGFPVWAVSSKYRREFAGQARDCGQMWALKSAITPDMHHAFHDFYADTEGARTAFLGLWERLARRLGSHPGVIGYDLFNEPWGVEQTELAPLYHDLAQVIRRWDPTSILFVEPTVFMTTFGFKKSELPQPDFGNFAYAPHYYDPVAAAFNSWALWRAGITKHAFKLMTAKAHELQAPLFVGEFGESATMGNSRWYSDFQYDELDAGFTSGAQWNYTPAWTAAQRDGWNDEDMSIVDGQGQLRAGFSPRPYVRALSGEPVSQLEVREGSGAFTSYALEWRQTGPGTTELYVPGAILSHPELFELSFAGPGLSCEPAAGFNSIRCLAPSTGEMRLLISRRTPVSRAGN